MLRYHSSQRWILADQSFLTNISFWSISFPFKYAMKESYIFSFYHLKIKANPALKLCISPISLADAGCDTRSIFKYSNVGLNSGSSFTLTGCLTKGKEPSLSYYLPVTGGRTAGFMPFPKKLEPQTPSTRIQTCVTNSISFKNNHFTKHISNTKSKFCWDLI